MDPKTKACWWMALGVCCVGWAGCSDDSDSTRNNDTLVQVPTLEEDFGLVNGQCSAKPTDYTREIAQRDAELWPACVSDNQEDYVLVGAEPPSTIARTEAFERIRALLFDVTSDPSSDAFTEARIAYLAPEGLQSRVTRRADYHFSTYPMVDPEACRKRPVTEGYEQVCAGPLAIEPTLNDAFQKGIEGVEPRVQAARIEAALLWFQYLSAYSEIHSGREKSADLNSSWAYYNGGREPSDGIGLARYVRDIDLDIDARAWDGLRAMRCWRSFVGDESVVSGFDDSTLADRRWAYARNQYDQALLHGFSRVISRRIEAFQQSTSDAERAAHWAFLQVAGPVLVRGAEGQNSAAGETLQREFANTSSDDFDAAAAIAAIDSAFECP
jgi:hypothetical protein